MTAVEMGAWFDLLQDKYNSPYFTDTEKSLFLTRAQENFVVEVVTNILDPEPDIEGTEQEIEKIQTLVYDDLSVSSAATGIVASGDIDTEIVSRAGAGNSLYKILSVRDNSGRPIMSVRHNDEGRLEQNVFKASSSSNLKRKYIAEGFRLIPNSAETVQVTVVKTPLAIDIGTTTDSELPSLSHNKIVAKALQLAGVTTEDEALLLIDNIS